MQIDTHHLVFVQINESRKDPGNPGKARLPEITIQCQKAQKNTP
jgi:hypothetical protein